MRLNTISHRSGVTACGVPRWVPPCTARRSPAVVVRAAKKGGDKKGGDKKGPKKSALADLLKKKAAGVSGTSPAEPSQYDTPESRMLAFQICDSYWRLTKKFLVEGVEFDKLPSALYRAPFALLAHNRFQPGVTDPIFTYGNRAALSLFEASWDEFLKMPSRKSAVDEPDAQKARNGLMDKAATSGVVSGFEAWRVSLKGRQFKLIDCTLFNVLDRQGNKVGQAAVFYRYGRQDGTIVEIASQQQEGELEAEAAEPAIPSPEEMQAAEAAVSEQAAQVRSLKEVQGLTNQDIPVQLAVFELKKRKEKLAQLQRKLEYALETSKAAFDDEGDE